MRGIQGFAIGLGVAGAAATGLALNTDRLQGKAHDVRRRAADAGEESARGKSDRLAHNVDGGVRVGLGAIGLLSIPTAAVAAITRRPVVAAGALGAGLGATGAALLAGNGGSIGHNLNSAGNAVNAAIHTAMRPEQPKVADRVPTAAPGAPEPKPTAQELREVQLPHLPGKPDMERAQREAQKTLDALDFSKRDLVVWVPGTGGHSIAESWKQGADAAFGERASQAFVDYPAEWNVGPSAATGMETLRLVLAGIAEKGGDHRVLLAGLSQGAWIIGDLMADPKVHAMVDRAVLFGQPGMAQTDYAHRRDAKVLEVSDANDPITWEMDDRDAFLRGMDEATRSKALAAPELLDVALQNPEHGAYFAAKLLDPERWSGDHDPHQYAENMADGARWLDTGRA